METITLASYGKVISDTALSSRIYNDIDRALQGDQIVEIDFSNVIAMATFCSKQIFGDFYIKLGSENFFNKVIIKNASRDMRVIVRLGIEKALESTSNVYPSNASIVSH